MKPRARERETEREDQKETWEIKSEREREFGSMEVEGRGTTSARCYVSHCPTKEREP
jgi:hypothetical protein